MSKKNPAILALEDGQVSFRWKDYRHPQRSKVMTLSAQEFIRRFLVHALPPGFQRIRYYGWLANCHRAGKLEVCRRLLSTPTRDLLPQPYQYTDCDAVLAASRVRLCPQCRIGILVRLPLPWPCPAAVPLRVDTS